MLVTNAFTLLSMLARFLSSLQLNRFDHAITVTRCAIAEQTLTRRSAFGTVELGVDGQTERQWPVEAKQSPWPLLAASPSLELDISKLAALDSQTLLS